MVPAWARRAKVPVHAAPRGAVRSRPGPGSSASPRTGSTPLPTETLAASFAALGVEPALVASLARRGIDSPFPIQTATLPDALAGRDVLGRGRTGSGKTVAFAVPVVTRLGASEQRSKPGRPRALILLPTRELATQVAETVEPLAATMGLKVAVIFGGVGQNPQVTALRHGADIVVACPGRLEDLIGQGHCKLDAVEVTVLDEADHMADLGFLPVVQKLLDRTPKGGQRLLFSATLDRGIDGIVRRYLSNPVTHSVDDVADAPPDMTHHVIQVAPGDKAAVVRELASGRGRSLLFTRTKHAAKKLARQLTAAGVPAVDLHGNLSQPARERNLAAFASGASKVLVATDIAARGIHVDDVALVVHVDPPVDHKAYLHRSGRTARAGAAGDVVTVMTRDQLSEVKDLCRKAGIRPTTAHVAPGDPRIVALTGEPAAHVTPAPVAAGPATKPRSRPRPQGSRTPRGPGRRRNAS
jgi:superfamily II DNA/RNA helicase